MNTFADAGIIGEFSYKPLEDPGAQIRVIHITPSDEDSAEIRCTTSVRHLSSAHPYVAISYTWGDMGDMQGITLDGKQLSIRRNSWLVLWQARLHKIPYPVWIDVLSIDQQNNNEKSVQVGMMASIYAKAKFTCIGLGAQNDDSEVLADQIRKRACYNEHVRAWSERPWSEPLACTACGSLPTPRMYRCKQCVNDTALCVACKETHAVQAGHNVSLDVRTDFRHRGVCNQCEQRLSTTWYQPEDSKEGHVPKVCELCITCHRNEASNDSWGSRYVQMNSWDHIVEPEDHKKVREYEDKTSKRFFHGSQEDHARAFDALHLLTMRPYFTRLWIVQEVKCSRYNVIACGQDLFHLSELEAFHELLVILRPPDEILRRLDDPGLSEAARATLELELDEPASYFFKTVIQELPRTPIWEVVGAFSMHRCSDPLDRVFGLLALTNSESREAFSPDYTKSATAILLELFDHYARSDESDGVVNTFFFAHLIIKAFGFHSHHPDITAMLDPRRTSVYGEEPFSEILTTEDQSVTAAQNPVPNSSSRLPRTIVSGGMHYLTLEAKAHCTVWKNDAGALVAPLRRLDSEDCPMRHSFAIGQGDTADGVRILMPDGSVAGFANKQIRPWDQILFFDGATSRPVFHSALIVRNYSSAIATIIGQCIFDTNFEVCSGISKCDCMDEAHSWGYETWRAYMSPEDLLVFIAQDSNLVRSESPYSPPATTDTLINRKKSWERLKMRVTSQEFSSYAMSVKTNMWES